MSFVPEWEAQNFDTQVPAFWSHLIQRDVTSPLFSLPLKLGELVVGSAVQRHAAARRCARQSVISTLTATAQSPDTDTLYNAAPRLRAQLAQLLTTLLTTDEQASLPPQTTWRCPSAKKSHIRSKSQQYNDISTSNFFKASLPHLLTVRCSSHNPPHTPELTSCSPAAKRTRLRTAVSVLP